MKVQGNSIQKVVKEFQDTANESHLHRHRYSTFDFCYHHFQKDDYLQDIEKSCFILWGYLGSWGMLRGSSFLLQDKNPTHFIKFIEYLSTIEKDYWNMDPNDFKDDNKRKRLIEIYNESKAIIIPDNQAHLTLLTKILLATIGSTPAFDRYFRNSFRKISQLTENPCSFTAFNDNSLKTISNFYSDNQADIDKLSQEIFVLDFQNNRTTLNYPKAKIIDMYGFQLGLKY